MYSIQQNLMPGIPQIPFDGGVGNYVGVLGHSTATFNDSADGERSYESRTFNDAFVHFFVDDVKIEQVASTNYISFGAGHTANHKGFAQVELCQTQDPAKFASAFAKYTYLLAKLLFDKKLPVVDGVTLMSHAQTSAKWKETDHTDPIEYIASHGKTWSNVVADVTANYSIMASNYSIMAGISAPKPVAVPSNTTSKQIQQGLNIAGYLGKDGNALIVDGDLGPNCVFAIKAFQRANSLSEDGVAGPVTQVALLNSTDHNKEIQKMLNALGMKGLDGRSLLVDGQLGANSAFAITKFQNTHGLSADGVCGPITFTKIETALQD